MPGNHKSQLEVPAVTEEDIAKSYREELDVKLRELLAIMNTALGDDLHTHFSLKLNPADGRYHFSDLYISKRY